MAHFGSFSQYAQQSATEPTATLPRSCSLTAVFSSTVPHDAGTGPGGDGGGSGGGGGSPAHCTEPLFEFEFHLLTVPDVKFRSQMPGDT